MLQCYYYDFFAFTPYLISIMNKQDIDNICCHFGLSLLNCLVHPGCSYPSERS